MLTLLRTTAPFNLLTVDVCPSVGCGQNKRAELFIEGLLKPVVSDELSLDQIQV